MVCAWDHNKVCLALRRAQSRRVETRRTGGRAFHSTYISKWTVTKRCKLTQKFPPFRHWLKGKARLSFAMSLRNPQGEGTTLFLGTWNLFRVQDNGQQRHTGWRNIGQCHWMMLSLTRISLALVSPPTSTLHCSSSFLNQLKSSSRRTDYLIFFSMVRLVLEKPRQLSLWQDEYMVPHFANKSLRLDPILVTGSDLMLNFTS